MKPKRNEEGGGGGEKKRERKRESLWTKSRETRDRNL